MSTQQYATDLVSLTPEQLLERCRESLVIADRSKDLHDWNFVVTCKNECRRRGRLDVFARAELDARAEVLARQQANGRGPTPADLADLDGED